MLELRPEWFEAHWRSSRSHAGKRYTPDLDVPLPIAEYFECALQEQPLFDRFAEIAADLEKAYIRFTRVKARTSGGSARPTAAWSGIRC
jgi:hypothetical protein